MIAYRCTNPRWPKVELRLLAYRPTHSNLNHDQVKVVLQSVDHGQPIAEDPIATEVMTVMDLCQILHRDLCDGWERMGEPIA